jgi:hypothetical protein
MQRAGLIMTASECLQLEKQARLAGKRAQQWQQVTAELRQTADRQEKVVLLLPQHGSLCCTPAIAALRIDSLVATAIA